MNSILLLDIPHQCYNQLILNQFLDETNWVPGSSKINCSHKNKNRISFILVSNISKSIFLLMKNSFISNLNLDSTFTTNSYLSSLTFTDSSNHTIHSKNLLFDILFSKFTSVNTETTCGFWDITNLKWSTDGCILKDIKPNGIYDCQCNHTTFFALLGVI